MSKKLFSKLKITSLLDLALLIPNSYIDNHLSSDITMGKSNTLQAKVIDLNSYNSKLILKLFLPKFNRYIKAIFFRVTPYHYQSFAVGKELVVQGKVEMYRESYQIAQPKVITAVGSIVPKYKTPITQAKHKELISTYLSMESLMGEGLTQREAKILLYLHSPKNLKYIYRDGELLPAVLEVLKEIEALNHLQKLSKKRVNYPAMESLFGDVAPFVDSLPFRLTSQQLSAIEDIRSDLASSRASQRMVVGDVGSGKTMVILASVMMAYPSRAILMAPTSLLALQLYEEATKYLPSYIDIALVMQSREEGEYREAHFTIGTHALLYLGDLPKAPLVMVDEQHRFGTTQRQLLESMSRGEEGKHSHFIQFSATPIPRTQAMMNSAMIDMSLITKTPFSKSITTEVIGKGDFGRLLGHIDMEIAKKHQVLIVYPLVEESESINYQSIKESREFWESRYLNTSVTHGKDKNKERVLVEFRDSGDILLATTVVEVGISLPRLTIIVIVAPERLGLASLHQLRGRVGRLGLDSWCYLFSHSGSSGRLDAFCRTSSGFDIASLDLKFRDGGDILDGTTQSGAKWRWLDMGEDEEIVARAKGRVRLD
jgi:ATP-dependent DNA helicase RecG